MASLQVALDLIALPDALALARRLQDVVDIVEIGTPMIIEYGLEAVRQMRSALPRTCLLADLKIMDAGFAEANAAFGAGADIVTVLGVAGDATVHQVVKAAQQHERRQVLVDLIECPEIASRASQLIDMGVDILGVHTSVDRGEAEESDRLTELRAVRRTCREATVAVAGGVNLQTCSAIVAGGADMVIIGSSITLADDPFEAASHFQRMVKDRP